MCSRCAGTWLADGYELLPDLRVEEEQARYEAHARQVRDEEDAS